MASAHKTHTQRGGQAAWKVARRRRLRRKRAHERNLLTEAEQPQTRAARLRAAVRAEMRTAAKYGPWRREYKQWLQKMREFQAWVADHQIS